MTPGFQDTARSVSGALRRSADIGGAVIAGSGWVHAVASVAVGGVPVSIEFLGRRRHLHQALATFFPKAAPPVALRFDGSLPGLLLHRRTVPAAGEQATVRLVDRVPSLGRGVDGRPTVAPYLRATLAVADDVEAQLAGIRNRQLRSRLRRLARSDATTTVTRHPSDLAFFYRTLYVPQAIHRFGRLAYLETEAGLSRLLARRGALLLVRQGPRLVGGALVYRPLTEPSTLVWAKLGLAGVSELAPSARGEATAALELAVIRHAIDLKVQTLDLGLCSASLVDGILIHKLRLGADLSPTPATPRFDLDLDPDGAPILAAEAPFFEVVRGRLRAVVGFGPAEDPPAPQRWAATMRDRTFPGLSEIEVHAPRQLAAPDLAARLAEALGEGAPRVTVVPGH